MKQLIKNYSFDKTAKTVTFSDFSSIRLDRVLLITNVTANVVIYQFNDPALGGTASTNVLTLTFNTSGMSNSDDLQIIYDCATGDPTYDTQPVSASSLPLPSGAATSVKQSDGSQKTQVVDGSGNVIGSTSNALDVNIKSGAPTTVTANAGTNLNTSALALETGGNLAAAKTDLDTIAGAVSSSKVQAQLVDSAGTNKLAINVSGQIGVSNFPASQTVGGTVTANIGTTNGLALDTTLTGGTQQTKLTDGTNIANILKNDGTAAGQNAQFTAGAFKEMGSLTAGSLNADLVASVDVANYRWFCLQITGTWSGTLTFQGSNDGSTWGSLLAYQLNAPTFLTSTVTANNIMHGALTTRFLRVRMTSYSSGTANGTLELYTVSPANLQFVNAQLAGGTNSIGSAVIQAVSGTALAADQTNSELRVSNYVKSTTAGDTALTLGQTTKAASLPVTIASDQGAFSFQGTSTEQASLSAGSLNADLVPSTDVSAYKWMSLHVGTSVYSGTLTFQGSNDNSNFVSVQLMLSGSYNVNNMTTVASGTNQIFTGPVYFRYLRVRMTAYTSGTATGTLELYGNSPSSVGVSTSAAVQSGTWTVQPGNTANTTPWAQNITQVGGSAVALGQTTMASSLPVTMASNQSDIKIQIDTLTAALTQANQLPVSNAGQQGMLTITGSLSANSDNSLTFSGNATVARRIRIQNESAGTIYWSLDAAASTGSPSLPAPVSNAAMVEWISMACTTLHIFIPSGGTTTLNGSGGVKVSAWA